MEQHLHSPEVYDFRKYDRIWQRVAPGLEPYPTSRQGQYVPAAASAQMPETAVQTQDTALAPVPSGQGLSAGQADLQQTAQRQTALVRQESQLPGASPDPCCMGSAAAEMLDVLTGFIEEELEEQRYYLALACQAGSARQASNARRMVSVRQRLRDLAAEEWAHAKRLMAVYYLITGECYQPSVSSDRVTIGRWCPALRERYHAAACSGLNYARAAEGTTDPCLSRLLNELSADEYRHADILLGILERSLRR